METKINIMSMKNGTALLYTALFVMLTPIKSWAAEAKDVVFYPDPSVANGKTIYLSPARHSNAGSRGECPNLGGNENSSALASALHIASNSTYSLITIGYEVRIGRGTLATAIKRSNEWKADIHIPIHSNARTENCNNGDASTHGAVIIYRSDKGKNLSTDILSQLTGITPGTNDFVCHESSPCTAYSSLAELRKTIAVAAYIEREFHTWDSGAKYLKSLTDSDSIVYGIRRYFNRYDDNGRPKWWSIWSWWASWSWSRR